MYKPFAITDIGNKGMISDIDPSLLDPGFVSDAQWVRFTDGGVQQMGGSISLLSELDDFGFSLPAGYGTGLTIVASATAVKAFDGSAVNDISNARSGAYSSVSGNKLWTGCQLGRIPIICNPALVMEYWNPQTIGTHMVDLPFDASHSWFQKSYAAKLIRSHKQFLFALSLQEGAAEYPDGVRWSNPADIGGLPSSWDETDPTKRAGKTTLGGNQGQIIDGLSLRDAFVIYRESGITVFDYVGGTYVWNIRNMTTTFQLINKECIAEVNGVHYVLGNNDICMNDGTNIESIATDKVRTYFRKTINNQAVDTCYVVNNKIKNEVMFCYPSGASARPDIALVYNWINKTWTKMNIVFCKTVFLSEYAPSSLDWNTIIGNWDQQQSTWNNAGGTFNAPVPKNLIGILKDCFTPANDLFAAFDLDGVLVVESTIERLDFMLDDTRSVKTLITAYPSGEGVMRFQFGSKMFHGDGINWTDWIEFDCNTQRQIDLLLTGSFFSYRVQSTSYSAWKLNKINFDYAEAGGR